MFENCCYKQVNDSKPVSSAHSEQTMGAPGLSRHNPSIEENTTLLGKTNSYNVMKPVKQAQNIMVAKKRNNDLIIY